VGLDLQKLAAAKLWLISEAPTSAMASVAHNAAAPRDLPYLASALYALVPVACDDVDRMTCDEWWRVYINTGWLAQATVGETGEELAHMTWHLLSDHTGRARDQNIDRSTVGDWNRATDATVAHTLAPDRLSPESMQTATTLGLRPGLSAEQYFASLSRLPVTAEPQGEPQQPPSGGCGSGADGLFRLHERGPDADVAAITSLDAREIRRKVSIGYEEHTLARGDQPGDALRSITQTLEPTVRWEPILTAAVRRATSWAAGRGEYTYSRPSRRGGSTAGVILPGQHRPVPRLSIVVDTSASVDDKLLERALGEVDGAIAALGISGASVTVFSVDAAVQTVNRVRKAKDAQLVGAGGTDLRIGLGAADAQRPRPDVVIIFTDGDTPWPETQLPNVAVVAALLGRNSAHLPPTPSWVMRVECILDF